MYGQVCSPEKAADASVTFGTKGLGLLARRLGGQGPSAPLPEGWGKDLFAHRSAGVGGGTAGSCVKDETK